MENTDLTDENIDLKQWTALIYKEFIAYINQLCNNSFYFYEEMLKEDI